MIILNETKKGLKESPISNDIDNLIKMSGSKIYDITWFPYRSETKNYTFVEFAVLGFSNSELEVYGKNTEIHILLNSITKIYIERKTSFLIYKVLTKQSGELSFHIDD